MIQGGKKNKNKKKEQEIIKTYKKTKGTPWIDFILVI